MTEFQGYIIILYLHFLVADTLTRPWMVVVSMCSGVAWLLLAASTLVSVS